MFVDCFLFVLFVLQSVMLQIAEKWIAEEAAEHKAFKDSYMAEHCPAPNLSGDQPALLVSDA